MNMKNSMPIITKENYKSPEILEQIQSLMTKFFLEYIFQFSKYLPEISESGKDEINLMEKTLLENKDMA